MSFPTVAAYRFCTTLANRTAISAATRLSGFLGGRRVLAGANNEIFGMLSDYVAWIYSGLGSSMTHPLGMGMYVQRGIGGETVTLVQAAAADPMDSTVKFTMDDVGSQVAYISTPIPLKAGKLTGATVEVAAEVASAQTYTLYVYNPDGSLRSDFQSTASGTGTKTLTGTALELDEPTIGIFELTLGNGGGTADTVTLTTLTTTWDAP